MVNPFPPAHAGTTVHSDDADGPGRGTWWGVAVIIIAVIVACAFAVVTNDGDDVARGVVAAQAALGGGQRPVPSAHGLAFPDLGRSDGWVPVGGGTSEVFDRRVTTVVYGRQGGRLAYSIVSGPPLGAPPDSRSVGGRMPVVLAFDAQGRSAVIVTRDGHSAVVSGAAVPLTVLVRAARGMPANG